MKRIMLGLALTHLTVIAAVILHGVDGMGYNTVWEKPLGCLCSINYSIWQYGFFSPDVGKSTELAITVYEDSNKVRRFVAPEEFRFFTKSSESAMRFYGYKRHSVTDSVFLDLCSRSAATRMFNLYPDSWRVDYSMTSIQYPTLVGLRRGDPIKRIPFYATTYVLK